MKVLEINMPRGVGEEHWESELGGGGQQPIVHIVHITGHKTRHVGNFMLLFILLF